jgi:hypothetical protein
VACPSLLTLAESALRVTTPTGTIKIGLHVIESVAEAVARASYSACLDRFSSGWIDPGWCGG